VLAGAGGAAGEAYAWAIENPEKVSCIYAENPSIIAIWRKFNHGKLRAFGESRDTCFARLR
jgi:hypothetical protein